MYFYIERENASEIYYNEGIGKNTYFLIKFSFITVKREIPTSQAVYS
jgi:hypothetical protein